MENKMQIAVAGYDTVTPARQFCNVYKLWQFPARPFICLISIFLFVLCLA
jgi:hypothetical protein